MARNGGIPASAPLIATKIAIPRRRSDTLRRARLVDAMDGMVDLQLYLLVAPAGYGKTTLLVDFASDTDMPICWYSLGPSDSEPAVFLEYLVAAIQSRFPRFGAETRRAIAQTNFRTDALAVVATLINEVQDSIPEYFGVILDDFHEVNRSPAVTQVVDALLKHAPENFKLIISSRTMPRLQMSRLAALRQAAGLGQNELRFTVDEVRALMRESYQTILPDRVIEELTVRSEGWITGIILTTHTMWQGLFESMIRKSGQEQLYGYLANEVFERQQPAVQHFLLASSVLEDLDPSVAGPLAGVRRADDILRQLEEGNLFVTELEGRKRVYRYHHLFREFLRSRLDEGSTGLSRPDLERRAGLLYQQRGQHELAIPHLLAAGAFPEAVESILAIADDAFNRGRLDTLSGWIDRLPPEQVLAQPRLALWRAQVAVQKGELDEAVRLASQIEQGASGQADASLAAEAKVHRAAACRLQGDNQAALRLCQEALAGFGDEYTRRRAQALRTMGAALWRIGSLEESRQALEQSHAIYARLGDVASSGYVQNDLGVAAMYDGRLGQARQHLNRAAALMEKTGNAGRWGLTLANLGVVAYLEDDPSEAIQLLERAGEKARDGLFPHAVVVAETSLGDVYRDLGRFGEADRHYSAALSVAEELVDRGELLELLCSMAESYRLQKLYSKAQVLLRRVEHQASGYLQAQARMLSGMCSLEQGRFKRARGMFQQALETFVSTGYRYLAARTVFQQAMLEFQTGHHEAGDAKLGESLRVLEDLGYAHFLAIDAPRWREHLEAAATRGIGERFLNRVLAPVAAPPSLVALREEVDMDSRPRALKARALGRAEVSLDGRPVPPRAWSSSAARELFYYLLLNEGGAPKDKLMAALAPEASPARANSQFHVAAYRLRRALYRGCVRYDGDSYQLDPQLRVEFDVDTFRAALEAANRAQRGSDAEIGALQRALNAYGGRFLEGSYAEWVLAEQRRLEDEFLHCASRLASAYLLRDDAQAAIATAQRGLEADNSLEELHEIVVRALLLDGRRSEALRHLESYGAYLQEELGAEVPAELRRLVDGGVARPHLLVSRS